MSEKRIYKVQFMNQGQVYEIYARNVTHGALFGFVEVSGLRFSESSSLVVNPAQEKIANEFAGVKSTYIPMHAIVRIDEVEKEGESRITEVKGGNVAQFPVPVYTPGGDK